MGMLYLTTTAQYNFVKRGQQDFACVGFRYLELKTPDLLVLTGAPYEPYVSTLMSAAADLQRGKCLPWNCSVYSTDQRMQGAS